MLDCDNSLGGVVVWRRGGEGGRVLAVGKMLVRRDGKGALFCLELCQILLFLVRVLSNSSLEVLEVSKDDTGEYVCTAETVGQTHLINIAGEDNSDHYQ